MSKKATALKITKQEYLRLKEVEKNYAKLLEFSLWSKRRFNNMASKPNEYWVQNMYGILETEIEQKLQELGIEPSDDEEESEEEVEEGDEVEEEDDLNIRKTQTIKK
jgi:hypothetical protein